jgi:hypothetical protein
VLERDAPVSASTAASMSGTGKLRIVNAVGVWSSFPTDTAEERTHNELMYEVIASIRDDPPSIGYAARPVIRDDPVAEIPGAEA